MVTILVGAGLVAAPGMAVAATPSSAVEVSPTSVLPGETFTVTQTIHNSASFTVTGARAALYRKGSSLVGTADLVSCTGALACFAFETAYRGAVGDLPSGESRTVVFTFRVKDDAAPGQFTLVHQLVGDNFSFEALDGPVISILSNKTDLAVSLDASARGLLASRVTYTITVRNNGPVDASNVRLTATYPAGLRYAGSSQCTRVPGTRTVTCDLATLANGATATRTFSADAALLSLGPLVASVERTQSTPGDSNPANDRATHTCRALTGLLISC